jgi:hypothetical protein
VTRKECANHLPRGILAVGVSDSTSTASAAKKGTAAEENPVVECRGRAGGERVVGPWIIGGGGTPN